MQYECMDKRFLLCKLTSVLDCIMKGKIIVSKFWTNFLSGRRAAAITIFPFILIIDKSFRYDRVLVNHERIHLSQALELLIVPFYVWYFTEFLLHYIRIRDFKQAYLRISFEREAYRNESNLQYLKTRKFWAFTAYFNSNNV